MAAKLIISPPEQQGRGFLATGGMQDARPRPVGAERVIPR